MKPTLSDKNTRMNIVISKDLKSRVEKQAQKEMRSLSNFICVALEKYLKEKTTTD